MRPSAKSARNAAPNRKPIKADARGARYQHHRVRTPCSGRKARRHHQSLVGREVHAPDLRSTLQKPRVSERIKPHKAGRLVNQVKKLAEDVDPLPRVERSPDPTDDFLLALSEGGKADYLVTGDKSGLLALDRHKATRIVTAREFAALFA